MAWLENIRVIDECINLQTDERNDPRLETLVFSMPVAGLLRDPRPLKQCHALLIARFSENFANCFSQLVFQAAATAASLHGHGLAAVSWAMRDVTSLIDYLQSRRRHFVALLHFLPHACRGKVHMTPWDALTVRLPVVELTGIQMMSAHDSLLLKLARESLGLPPAASGHVPMLAAAFLEPERSRLDEVPWSNAGELHFYALKEPLQHDRLFSAAELSNDILATEAAYAEFNLDNSDLAVAAALTRKLSCQNTYRDFWVMVSPEDLDTMLERVKAPRSLRDALIHTVSGYMDGLSNYAPFILVDDTLHSTVSLLSASCTTGARTLDKRKRYQTRTGFIFESVVKNRLTEQGFAVQHIRRISRREFDVVTVFEGVVGNVQCKNNFVELANVDADARRFARYNRALVLAYEKALAKERNREHLLRERLAIDEVELWWSRRFPSSAITRVSCRSAKSTDLRRGQKSCWQGEGEPQGVGQARGGRNGQAPPRREERVLCPRSTS